MQPFFLQMLMIPCDSKVFRDEHWTWSQEAGILRAALSPAGSEMCCLCFNLLFNESTGLLINNKGKI